MDVFQVVKALRVQKPGAVRTVVRLSSGNPPLKIVAIILSLPLQEQYQTVFEAVLVFLDSFDTYSNF